MTIARALPRLREPGVAALLVLAGAAATIAGALLFEHGLGYVPCKLCLTERQPYYLAMPLAALAFLASGSPGRLPRLVLALAGLVLVVGAGLGVYHAGAEWGFWAGPSDCGGGSGPAAAGVQDFMRQLERTRVVACTEAAWRFLGLSLAGWNALIASGLAALALAAAAFPRV
jgi:disulfide bond formation protein DsbB